MHKVRISNVDGLGNDDNSIDLIIRCFQNVQPWNVISMCFFFVSLHKIRAMSDSNQNRKQRQIPLAAAKIKRKQKMSPRDLNKYFSV